MEQVEKPAFLFFMKFLLLLFTFTGCSSFNFPEWGTQKDKEIELKSYQEYSSSDYVDHLASFDKFYRDEQTRNIMKMDRSSIKYLNSIISKITSSNELFFEKGNESSFVIVKNKIPFHFSLPNRKFYFSTGLLRKYIKNEEMLYCIVAYELIRSEKNIYPRTIIIPTGNLNTNRVLSLLRLNTQDKVEIHKWAYYLLKRSGVNTDSYLSWLQIKNRNSLDFSLQLGDIRAISREEALYKAFLIDIEKDTKRMTGHQGSSKLFYQFLRDIKL